MKLSCLLLAASFSLLAQKTAPFEVEEATIADVHDAMKAGRLTCRALVEAYLNRIAAYDKNGPAINSIILINPDAAKQADELDRRFAQSGLTGPLHCVPMIVKDNFETKGLQSSNGALAFQGYVPDKDAFQVKRVKEAGAIVLAKTFGSGLLPKLALHGMPIAVLAAAILAVVLVIWFFLAMLRLVFLLAPVAATEHRMRLSRAWALTHGSALRILVVLIGTFLPAMIAAPSRPNNF